MRLQPPVLHPPLLLHPLGFPPPEEVPQLLHPIIKISNELRNMGGKEKAGNRLQAY
jgi:hypothetical protein